MTRTPVADQALLSDARTAALVTSHGSADWLCPPRFDSPSVLARLVRKVRGLVPQTVWSYASGRLTVRDCLALDEHERGHDLGRASPGVLLRHVRCESGAVEVVVPWAPPRPEFGLVQPSPAVQRPGEPRGASVLVLSTDLDKTVEAATAEERVTLANGHDLALAMEQLDAWQSWSSLHQRYEGPLEALVAPKRVGPAEIWLHDARHTALTMMSLRGVPLSVVAA